MQQYQPSRYPSEMILQMLNQQKERERQASNAPLDNLVNALQILANKYSDNKTLEKRNALDINKEANKLTTEQYLKGGVNFSSPASAPQNGAEGPSAPERPYYPQVKELLSGNLPQNTIVKPDTALKDSLTMANINNKNSSTNLNSGRLEQLKTQMMLQKELTADPVAFKNKYGDNVMQMIRALPPFNVMDLLSELGMGGGLPGTQPTTPTTPIPTTPKQTPTPQSPGVSADVPPPMPGTVVGQMKKDTQTGKIWKWDGSKWIIGG